MQIVLTPEILRAAYAQGIFPMAEAAHSEYVHWYCPEKRGQLSIAKMHIPKRLKKNLRQMKINGSFYEVRINQDFEAVIRACAVTKEGRTDTWINEKIISSFCALNAQGHAHSVEIYQNNKLVGGLYGVAFGAVFCGESMFSNVRDASKVALAHLAARLYHQGYEVLDTQFINDHLKQFGVYEIEYEEYIALLAKWGNQPRSFISEQAQSEKKMMAQYLERNALV